jgi:hypothetical protein
MLEKKKSPDSTSRRSVAHATDSTRRGCSANTNAEKAAASVTGTSVSLDASRALEASSVRARTYTITAFAACKSKLVRW